MPESRLRAHTDRSIEAHPAVTLTSGDVVIFRR